MAKKKSPQVKAAEAINPILEAGKSINVSELAEELISALGGTRKFAHMYAEEIRDAKEGSVAKAKMMDAVLKIVASATTINKTQQRHEDDMSLEELAETARMLLMRHATPDAPPPVEAADEPG